MTKGAKGAKNPIVKKRVLREGNERVTYCNGDKYVGKMNGNKKDGYGKMFYHDGSKYLGYFRNDVGHGQGKFWNKDPW